MAVKAVNEWHENLVRVTGDDKVWNMTSHVESKDTDMCDGFINFYKTPNDIKHQIYGVAGFSNLHTQLQQMFGERANLIIQAPFKDKLIPTDSISAYIFPEGKKVNQKYQSAPIKIVKDHGKTFLQNNGGYFDYIKSIPVTWVNDKFVMTIHFVPNVEIETADITGIIKNHADFGEQWEIEDAFHVKKALFSDMLLDDTDYHWAWKMGIGNSGS